MNRRSETINKKRGNISLFTCAFLLLAQSRSTYAYPSAAGACYGGFPGAVGGNHIQSGSTTMEALAGGFEVHIDGPNFSGGVILPSDAAVDIQVGESYKMSLVALGDQFFRGFLIRLGGMVNTIQALQPLDDKSQIAYRCIDDEGVGGLSHTDRDRKTTASGILQVDTVTDNLLLEITIVKQNNSTGSIWYYSNFTLNTVESSAPAQIQMRETLALDLNQSEELIRTRHYDPPKNKNVKDVFGTSPTSTQVSPSMQPSVDQTSTMPSMAPSTSKSSAPTISPSLSVTPSVAEDTSPPSVLPSLSILPSFTPSVAPTQEISTAPSPQEQESLAPSFAPSRVPSTAPSVPSVPTVTFTSIEDFLSRTMTDDGSLNQTGTPQNDAFLLTLETYPNVDVNDPDNLVQIAQSYALNTFFYSTGGSNWGTKTKWATTEPICTEPWYGVTCTDAVVTGVDLNENGLAQNIPSEISGLSSSTSLVLNNNDIVTITPGGIQNLLQLKVLNLNTNLLSATLPTDFGGLPNLEELDLGTNSFFKIPSEIGLITSLVQFKCTSNFLSGTIPTEIGMLTALENFDLSLNFLSGTLPSEIGTMTKLVRLEFYRNHLGGTLPLELGSLSNLEVLSLYENLVETDINSGFEGDIPEAFGGLTSIKEIDLYFNRLGPKISNIFSQVQSLVYFDVGANFIEEISPSLFELPLLGNLMLDDNFIAGPLPPGVQLPELITIDLSRNLFTGSLPVALSESNKLESLLLEDNRLSETIPLELGSLTALTRLSLAINDFTGPLPSECGKLTNLISLFVDENSLNGAIPVELSEATSLIALYLSMNNFSGELPIELTTLKDLEVLSGFSNNLTGGLPTELGDLNKMSKLDLSDNSFAGPIPSEMGKLLLLEELKLDENQLTGLIPSELGQTSLKVALFQTNNLTGEVPGQLCLLNPEELVVDCAGDTPEVICPAECCSDCGPLTRRLERSGHLFNEYINSST